MNDWRVDFSDLVLRRELAEWLNAAPTRAARTERLHRAVTASEEMIRRLRANPHAAGDPRNFLRQAEILKCIAVVDGFCFSFGIHDPSRTVWITKIVGPSR